MSGAAVSSLPEVVLKILACRGYHTANYSPITTVGFAGGWLRLVGGAGSTLQCEGSKHSVFHIFTNSVQLLARKPFNPQPLIYLLTNSNGYGNL
jgi:hypothetical protein